MKSDIELAELRVIDLSRGGAGVGRDDAGRVIFVPFTAPGDRVRAKIIQADKRYAMAELIEVIEFSSIREKPRCPVFGQCGGCQWQHLPYEFQWETKFKGALEALKRVSVRLPEKIDLNPAQEPWEYRNRIQLRGEAGEIGFYRQSSQQLVPIQSCFIARPELNQALDLTRIEGSQLHFPYKVELEVLPSGEIKRAWNARHAARGFRQVNDVQNEKLKKWIAQEMMPSDVLLDLFGGAGNLSLPLAGKIKEIHCVDRSAPATRPVSAPAGLHFHREDVLKWMTQFRFLGHSRKAGAALKGSALMDPPRGGLGEKFSGIATAIERLRIRQVITVGCDVDAWASDVARGCQRGWKLKKLMFIDFFPQTTHLESVAVFDCPTGDQETGQERN